MLRCFGKVYGTILQSVTLQTWIKELESNYCLNATQKLYEIDKMAIDKTIIKLKPKKAQGRNMITGY